jgi:hypothetical protein
MLGMIDLSACGKENSVPMIPTSLSHPEKPDKDIKHFFLISAPPARAQTEYVPHFYFEAKIDLADVRSGLRKTFGVNEATEVSPFHSEDELLWTRDMVLPVDPENVQAGIPEFATLAPLPVPVTKETLVLMETRFLNFLMRHFVVRVFRNFHLNLYSNSEESSRDFMMRCVEVLKGPFRRDLDALHEVYKRRLEQIKEKYGKVGEFDYSDTSGKASQSKNLLHRMSEKITDLFLRVEFCIDSPPMIFEQGEPRVSELEERLAGLEEEACLAIMRLLSDYREKALNTDEYIIRPQLKDIHMVGTHLLWVPAKAV